jgi:hypothetical protein
MTKITHFNREANPKYRTIGMAGSTTIFTQQFPANNYTQQGHHDKHFNSNNIKTTTTGNQGCNHKYTAPKTT